MSVILYDVDSCCMSIQSEILPQVQGAEADLVAASRGSDGETSIDTMLINAHGISSKHIKTHQNHQSESRSCMENGKQRLL